MGTDNCVTDSVLDSSSVCGGADKDFSQPSAGQKLEDEIIPIPLGEDCVAHLHIAPEKHQRFPAPAESASASAAENSDQQASSSATDHGAAALESSIAAAEAGCPWARRRLSRRMSHHGGLDDPLFTEEELSMVRLDAVLEANEPRDSGVHTPPASPRHFLLSTAVHGAAPV
eukprot:CAMPEP_0202893756 /NCGR_PEP_ID=MMETSP1392-20130828/3271_1 /ASSEMBLY_ACC=CAM_ASM_000868 /TAXON_ID=225041 /ORGANISM="Chlamydomonas chlamydogama, Strain SAG 11-48b" /LENGTH=171 /DNA_ID=CAMNT_0049578203 /DNA_START=216 /DNA_END=731 /DNA_ORIENTATION=+